MKFLFPLIFLAGIRLLPAEARAQIVNVQPLIAQEARAGFSGAVEASVDWRTGNTALLLLSGNALARWLAGRHLVFALVHGDLGEKGGANFVNRDLEHLRYRVRAARALDVEAFAQHDRDEFRRLALRVVGGGGPRLQIVATPSVDAAIAAAYLVEYERLRSGPEPDAGRTRLDHRLSSYVAIRVRLGERLRLGHTAYVQPRLDDPRDVRLLSETEILVAATAHVALKTAVTLQFDARPPVAVQPLDTTIKSSLQVTF